MEAHTSNYCLGYLDKWSRIKMIGGVYSISQKKQILSSEAQMQRQNTQVEK